MKKYLSTLSRIQKFNIDEKRKVLADLLTREENLQKKIQMLIEEYEREKEFSSNNESPSFGAYLKRYLKTKESLEQSLRTLQVEIEKVKDQISEMYKEQKTYDIVEENRKKAKQKEEDDKEQKSLDEIGTNKYIKDKKLK